MDPNTSPPVDAPKILNIRKAPILQGHVDKFEGIKESSPLLSTLISIPKQPRALLVEKDKEENVRIWNITNCDNLSEALNFFDSNSLKLELDESTNILVLRFEVDEDFVKLNMREISDLASKCVEKSVIILLMSKQFRKFSIFWKSKDIKSLLALKTYKERLSEDYIELYEFVTVFLTSSLKKGHLGLYSGYTNRNESNKIELHLLADSRGYNLLLLAVESGNSKIAKMLLESGLSSDLPDNSDSAQSIAVKFGHFNVLLMLLQSNLTYPSSLDITKCPADVHQFIESSKILRRALKDNDVVKVEEILNNNRNLRYFYTTNNESAPKFAIENNLIDMYEVLLTNKVLFGPHEDVNVIMNKLDYDEKRHLREVHFKHSIDMPEKHINILMSNSYVGHEEVTNVQEKLNLVQNAFKLLNENPSIKIILLIVAASKKFRIIFDFNRDSVEFIDPTAQSYTAGLFYLSGRMYIGAKQLLDGAQQHEAIGTIAHELCHYAMNLVFNNDANPYKKDDQESQDIIEEVSRECKAKKGTENIVDMVYDFYPDDRHHAEMIVRAPHMMAHYHDQPEKLEECKEKFDGLFRLYEEKVIPEMKKALPEIEERVEKEIANKDKEISKLRKRFFLAIIMFIISLIGVGTFAYFYRQTVYEYRKLTSEDRQEIENHSVLYAGTKLRFNDIFKSNSSVYYELNSNVVKNLLKNDEPLNIEKYESFIKLNWTSLAKPLKQKFLNSNLIFQSERLKFKDFHQNYSECFDFLNHNEIKQVLFNGSLEVGDMVKTDVKFYIQRSFIDENINLVFHKFKTDNLNESFKDFYEDFVNKSYDEYHMQLHEIEESDTFISNPQALPLNSDDLDFAQLNFDKLITRAKTKRFIILSDEAGTGKTVTFKNLAKYIKSKNPLSWVTYIDLKNSEASKLDPLRNFQTKSDFDKNIFKKAFNSNQTFILWNGLDEVSSEYYDKIMTTFDSLHVNTTVIQFVCTRPNHSHDLQTRLKQISFKLVPFNVEVRKDFITSYINSKGNSTNVGTRIERTIKQIEILEKKSSSNDLNTPLILIMIADIEDSDTVLESANLYSIYETFIHNKIDIWKKRTNSSDNFITKIISGKENLIKVLHFYALYNEVTNLNTINLLKILNLDGFNLEYLYNINSSSEIAQIGILHDDGYGNLKLSHKSFAEFLMAQYFIDNVYNSNSCTGSDEAKIRVELFFHFIRMYGHGQWLITDFIKDFLVLQSKKTQENQNIITESIKSNHRNRDKQKSHKRKNSKSNQSFNAEIVSSIEDDYSEALFNLLATDQPQILEFLFDFFKKDLEVFKTLLQYNQLETLYTAAFNPIYNAYHIDPNMILDLVNKTNVLSESEFEEFQNGTDQEGTIILGMFHYQNGKIPREHEKFSQIEFTVNSTLCDLFDALNTSLSDEQWSNLFYYKAGSVIIPNYLYNAQKATSDHKIGNYPLTSNTLSCYDSFWSVIDSLEGNYKEKCFENSLTHYLQISSSPSYPHDEQQLKYLLHHFERSLNTDQIIAIIKSENLLHIAALKVENFKIIWEFYTRICKKAQKEKENSSGNNKEVSADNAESSENYDEDSSDGSGNYEEVGSGSSDNNEEVGSGSSGNNEEVGSGSSDNNEEVGSGSSSNSSETYEEDIQLILTVQDDGIFIYDNFNLTRTARNESVPYNSRYFLEWPQSILYRGITNAKSNSTFDYFISIYKEYLDDDEIIDILADSILDILVFTAIAKPDICKKFASFLGEIFKNDMDRLEKFLNSELDNEYEVHEIFNDIIKKRLVCSNKIYNLIKKNENTDNHDEDENESEYDDDDPVINYFMH
ncbi:uncharacterized protein [Chironomus tepperi]|uniref:uncharacterized protein n=1 Tax=Chironomus tepperi TaxID=113505 RepID=UPI00391F2001